VTLIADVMAARARRIRLQPAPTVIACCGTLIRMVDKLLPADDAIIFVSGFAGFRFFLLSGEYNAPTTALSINSGCSGGSKKEADTETTFTAAGLSGGRLEIREIGGFPGFVKGTKGAEARAYWTAQI
jgi:hypothetical protein